MSKSSSLLSVDPKLFDWIIRCHLSGYLYHKSKLFILIQDNLLIFKNFIYFSIALYLEQDFSKLSAWCTLCNQM